MRNLKKILALVLALIMSLSLMATAGATDFKDDENVGDVYRQAVEVLSDLGVFNGDQNGNFNPEKPITRAEVAAIIYRIATGDVNNERNDSYAPYNQFPDIMEGDWYAGYVTYCANAGYVKGRNTGKFDPKDNVTGYEVLAMILRAVGYDKNNEFVGSNWQTNTASLATQKDVLKNITSATSLGAPATRETVAELLFRTILLPQVNWNSATLSYDANRETLAKENLNMEQVEGVVMANEWANINPDKDGGNYSIAEGKTELKLADGSVRTLNVATDLTDIGESRYAYVKINGEGVSTDKVLGKLEDTGKNTVKDCVDLDPQGKGTSVGALAGSLNLTDAQYFVNFAYGTKDTSDYRIEYSISFRSEAALEWFETKYLGQNEYNEIELQDEAKKDNTRYERDAKDVDYLHYGLDTDYYENADGTTNTGKEAGRTFSRVIPAGDKITALDVSIMKGIFGSAASFDSKHTDFSSMDEINLAGYVYAGSKSRPDTADRKDDLSDDRTYQQFADEYIGTDVTTSYGYNDNGEWMKVIDNNADGKAEYVFDTWYSLVEVDSYNDRTKEYTFSNGDTDEYAVYRDASYEMAIGDMLLAAWIDNNLVIEEAKSEIVVIEKYSWKDESVTTKDGAELFESGEGIYNGTGYADRIADMQYGIEYEVFYDHYGFIRAYRPVNSDRNYGLLTDLYLDDYRNTHYIYNQTATVELSFVDENGKLDMDEYVVANHNGGDVINPFVGIKQVVNPTTNRYDNLQRAIAHLDLPVRSTAAGFNDGRTVNNGQVFGANSVIGAEFDYDGVSNIGVKAAIGAAATDIDFSATNVARYTMNEDGTVTLVTAAEYAYDKAGARLYYWRSVETVPGTPDHPWGATDAIGNLGVGGTRMTEAEWRNAYAKSTKKDLSVAADATYVKNALTACLVPVYAVDYVMLDTTNDKADTIGNTTYRFKIDDTYKTTNLGDTDNLYNWHVNAVSDTVFYVVTDGGVYPFVGYKSLPTIDTKDITAMYAVARNVEQDNSRTDYWVADVVVIEVPALSTAYGHMIYNVYDNYRAGQKGIIHNLDAIDCVTGETTTVIVDSSWQQPYNTGFYVLANPEVAEDGTVTATGMQRVEDNTLFTKAGSKGYNAFGIYAGEVVRANEVEDKGSYIEIFDQTTDKNVNGDEIKVELNGAPWYSVHGYYTEASKPAGRFTATQLSNYDYENGRPTGHEVIYVKSGSKVLFVIDTEVPTGIYEDIPYYLNTFNGETYADADLPCDIYDEIREDQTGAPAVTGDGKAHFTTSYTEYLDGTTVKDFPQVADITDLKGIVTMDGKMNITVANLKSAADSKVTYAAPTGYTLVDVKSASTNYTAVLNSGVITVTAVDKYDLSQGVSLQLVYKFVENNTSKTPALIDGIDKDDNVAIPDAMVKIDGLKQVNDTEDSKIRAGETAVADPEVGDMVRLYFSVHKDYTVTNVTVNTPEVAGTYKATDVVDDADRLGAATANYVQYWITIRMPSEVFDLTVNTTTTSVQIQLPTGVTELGSSQINVGGANVTPKTAYTKGEAMTNTYVQLKVAGTSSLPESVTVSVGGTELKDTEYTYDKDTGLINFTKAGLKAANPIVIEGTVKAQTATLALTLGDLSIRDVVVKQGETVVSNNAGKAEWTLEKGKPCTITVTTKAGLTATAVAGTSSDLSFTKNNDGTWTYTNANVTDNISSTIGVTYERVTLKLTGVDSVAHCTVTVNDGAVVNVSNTNEYSVLKGAEVTITVAPATEYALESVTVAPAGLTFTKSGDNYVASTTLTEAKTYTSFTVETRPTAISPALTTKTGVAMTSAAKLTLDAEDTCEATFTVAKTVWAQEGGAGKFKVSFVVTLEDDFTATVKTPAGWTATAGASNAWTITGPELDEQPADDATVVLTITYAPAP